MKAIRISVLAAATAAMLAAPITSAEAHRRNFPHHHHHHGNNAAGAIALGIISGALIGQALAPRYSYRAPANYCYDPYGRAYYCDYRVHYSQPHSRMVPRSPYFDPPGYYRHHDRIFGTQDYYQRLRQERR